MTVTIDAPALTATAIRPQTDRWFRVVFLGLGGRGRAPLHQVTDARLVTVTGQVSGLWLEGRTVWLQLRAADGNSGLIALDMARALDIPAALYGVGQRVQVHGVARTHRRMKTPHVAVRELTAA